MTTELQDRIGELVLTGDAPSIIWIVEGQIRINTALEQERAALWAFLRAYDIYYDAAQVCDQEGCANPEALLPRLGPSHAAREALRQYEDGSHDCDAEYRQDCARCNGVAPMDAGCW